MQDPEVVREFLVESYENLVRLDQELVELEKRPRDAELLADILARSIRSKGHADSWDFRRWRRSPTRPRSCSGSSARAGWRCRPS